MQTETKHSEIREILQARFRAMTDARLAEHYLITLAFATDPELRAQGRAKLGRSETETDEQSLRAITSNLNLIQLEIERRIAAEELASQRPVTLHS